MFRALSLALAAPLLAQANQDPNLMDYGPFLSATVSAPWPKDNVTLKGIAIQLGARPGYAKQAGVLFDTELLRLAAGWTGDFLQLTGTPYDGAHGGHPRVAGKMVFGTSAAPGAANHGTFADPRPIPHGPLPRAWGRYKGLYRHGERTLLAYTIGQRGVLETHDYEHKGGLGLISRTLELGPGEALQLVLGEREGAAASAEGELGLLRRKPPAEGLVTVERIRGAWETLSQQGPAASDHADASSGHGVAFRWVESQGKPHANAGAEGALLPRLADGLVQENADHVDRSVFFDGDKGRIVADLNKPLRVQRISTFSWHRAERAAQRYTLYGSAAATQPKADGAEPAQDGWNRIASVDTTGLGQGNKHAARIQQRGALLGEFRWLLFDVQKAHGGTFFSEIDVVEAGSEPDLPAPSSDDLATAFLLLGAPAGTALRAVAGGRIELVVPAATETVRFKILHWDGNAKDVARLQRLVNTKAIAPAQALEPLCHGGPRLFPGALATTGTLGKTDGAYAIDTITVPEENPWKSRMRCAAFDLFTDGRAAVSTWNGDVWLVSGLDDQLAHLTWKRFAAGLFDPLGLRIVGDKVYTLGRDQITRLHDLNDDGEADFYENFNNEVLITAAFHEFAFDLQTDREGNFYFSKAGPVRSGGRGFEKLVPHHGALLKVAADGNSISAVATGLRAPNGIGVGPNGELSSGDNEGTWMPRCRLNWIVPGTFCGCVDTAHRAEKPKTYDPPLCFLPMEVDNSGGGQVWVTSDRWGPFQGEMLHLSYGQCSLYKVLKEFVDGTPQGGVVAFPLSFASSLMRGRFSEKDGQLYVIGFKGWQTRAAWDTAFQRVRYTGKKTYLPTALAVRPDGVAITFVDELDPKTAEDVQSYDVSQWNYLWTERYGSPEVSLKKPVPDFAKLPNINYNDFKEHDAVAIKSARLAADKKTVFLELEAVVPVMQMRIAYNLDAADGAPVKGEIYNTINRVPAVK